MKPTQEGDTPVSPWTLEGLLSRSNKREKSSKDLSSERANSRLTLETTVQRTVTYDIPHQESRTEPNTQKSPRLTKERNPDKTKHRRHECVLSDPTSFASTKIERSTDSPRTRRDHNGPEQTTQPSRPRSVAPLHVRGSSAIEDERISRLRDQLDGVNAEIDRKITELFYLRNFKQSLDAELRMEERRVMRDSLQMRVDAEKEINKTLKQFRRDSTYEFASTPAKEEKREST